MVRSESTTSVIYLMGMPGCGKTTLGKELALKLGYNFIDLDDYIEQKEDLSISTIFQIHGEDHFRLAEQNAVKDSTEWSKTVVACGGGAPCFFDNMTMMNEAGKTIFIDVSVKELLNRLNGKGQNKRPILANKSLLELENELDTKLNDRKVFFNNAQMILTSDNLKSKELFDLID